MSRRARIKRSGKIVRKQLKRRPTSGDNSTAPRFHPYLLPHSKLTDQVRRNFVGVIRKGLPPDRACDYIGISENTYYKWMRNGRTYEEQLITNEQNDNHEPYFRFYKAVKHAMAAWQLEFIERLGENDIEKMWYRNISVLERRDPQNWGKRADISPQSEEYNPDEAYL